MANLSRKVMLGFVVMLLSLTTVLAQKATVSGRVTDSNGEAVIGATVSVQGTAMGTATDANGNYSLQVSRGNVSLVYSAVAMTSQTITKNITGDMGNLDVVLSSSDVMLNEVVISVGTRSTQRTVTDAPIPVDVLSTKDLQISGQASFDKALQYRVPSFNSVNTPVNDASTLLDPYEIRNLGPSRSLILVNGKRKNTSSLLYVQFSPGRGETGADLSAIPVDAIKRVEILRDGASAQYGSDAIAGVMDIKLKDRYDYSTLNLHFGTSTTSDDRSIAAPGNGRGDNYGVALNSGANLGDRGYINYTIDLSQQNSAIRSGIVDVRTEKFTFGTGDDPSATNDNIDAYLRKYPTGNNINGSGDITAAKFLGNVGLEVGAKGLFYANAAYVTKKANSFANFRVPYWKLDYGLLHTTDPNGVNYTGAGDEYKGYLGYVPTFEGDLADYNGTIGFKDEHSGWKHDVSLTFGGNRQTYTVNNTVNHSLKENSPTSYKTGGFDFSHVVGNLDLTKDFMDNTLHFGVGTEGRTETFQIIAGDTASYSGQGSNSFPGINSVNATTNSRYNLGAYADLGYDITSDFLINGTVRTEKYSDFGNTTVWKASSRYKIGSKATIRGSYSTGFRAPSLHQIYDQSTQATFVGGTIQLGGLFNNNSVQARLLGIPKLRPEESTNISFGVGLNPTRNFNLSVDYYSINIKDRIVYSSTISSSDPNTLLYQILQKADVVNISFFINGVETNTSGLDFVGSYRNIMLGSTGKLAINLAGNYTLKNEIVGAPTEPDAIKAAGSSILSAQIRSLLTESRPEYKAILGLDFGMGKWGFSVNNTLYGPTRFQDLDNGGGIMNHIKQEFKPAVVTDLSVYFDLSKKCTLTLAANNLLNVLPKWDLVLVDDDATARATLANPADKALLEGFLEFSGRYKTLGYNGSQFSQLGTTLNANLAVHF